MSLHWLEIFLGDCNEQISIEISPNAIYLAENSLRTLISNFLDEYLESTMIRFHSPPGQFLWQSMFVLGSLTNFYAKIHFPGRVALLPFHHKVWQHLIAY